MWAQITTGWHPGGKAAGELPESKRDRSPAEGPEAECGRTGDLIFDKFIYDLISLQYEGVLRRYAQTHSRERRYK